MEGDVSGTAGARAWSLEAMAVVTAKTGAIGGVRVAGHAQRDAGDGGARPDFHGGRSRKMTLIGLLQHGQGRGRAGFGAGGWNGPTKSGLPVWKAMCSRLVLAARVAEAVVADGAHAGRQDMEEISPDELGAGNGLVAPRVALGVVDPAEGDGMVVGCEDARVADGRAADIGAEVFDGGLAVAEGLEVDAPVLVPDGGIGRASCRERV